MDDKGNPKDIIENILKSRLTKDLNFDSGKILGSMCTRPHPFAKDIFSQYIEKNIGDPGLVNSTEKLEKEAINMIGKLLSLKNAYGYIVTGGTEANILALWTARNYAGAKPGIGEVIVPESCHFSFDKIGDLLCLKIIKISLTDKFQIDIKKVKQAITPRTVALVGVAGTTSLGAVDPIKKLSEIAEEHGIYLHIDAAFGGYVLPFLKDLGFPSPPFNFKLKGVRSITIDPHKMGMGVIPGGGIIYRNPEMVEKAKFPVSYLAGGENALPTIVGTRSGASVLSVWALLKHLGKSGYKTIVRRCMDLTFMLAEKIKEMKSVDLVMWPVINIVGIKSDSLNIKDIAFGLRKRGWAISLFKEHIRIVIMPHLYSDHIASFTDDLKKVVDEL